MDRREWLASRLATAKEIRKRWEKREKQWREELLPLLDEEVGYLEQFQQAIGTESAETLDDAKTIAQNMHGEGYEIVDAKSYDQGWLITLKKRAAYTTVKVNAGDYRIVRTAYNLSPDLDLARLKEVAPEIYDRVVKLENVVVETLDEDALKEVISESQRSFDKVRLAMMAGDPRTRLEVKWDENSSSGSAQDGQDETLEGTEG